MTVIRSRSPNRRSDLSIQRAAVSNAHRFTSSANCSWRWIRFRRGRGRAAPRQSSITGRQRCLCSGWILHSVDF